MPNIPDCLVLFSGGLDSLLAAKLLQKQGLAPLCVHFFSPFFGSTNKIRRWEEIYNLKIQPVDASNEFIAMFVNSPPHGTGKTLNPCIDCKIILLRLARKLMESTGAKFIATGEVTGQRPMSQRPDAMRVIAKESGCGDALLRPLCAKYCPPGAMAFKDILNLAELPNISGRGRNIQLQLAKDMGIDEIPTPAGGCLLTEVENSRRYWMILDRYKKGIGAQTVPELVHDFYLANLGRMLLNLDSDARHWLCVGRNKSDNQKIINAKNADDIILRLPFPGPLALCREGKYWPEGKLREACEILAAFSTRPGQSAVDIAEAGGEARWPGVYANRHSETWGLPSWQDIREELRALRRQKPQSGRRNETVSLAALNFHDQ